MRILPFNQQWHWRKAADPPSSARPCTLPHDAMLYETRSATASGRYNTGWFPGGRYNYTRSFQVPDDWKEKTALLVFEGVYQRSEVYINSHLAAARPSGYAEFHVPLDDFLLYGSLNQVEVIVNNAEQPNSRWYTGSGIYRPVHLLLGSSLAHIDAWGPQVTTMTVADGSATLQLRTYIHRKCDVNLSAVITISNPDGDTLCSKTVGQEQWENDLIDEELTVTAPPLWSLEAPRLCTVLVQLLADRSILDSSCDKFGIRKVSLDVEKGLLINGVPTKIRGCNIHHDNGVIGAHTFDSVEARRVRIVKESGYNAIRSAHNPISRALLKACDNLGVLVMDELTDVWQIPKTKFDYSREFLSWWKQDLTAMILKDINHPSVIIYSIGNEIGQTGVPSGIAQNRAMVDHIKAMDPSRLVCNGVNGVANMGARELKPDEKPVSQEDSVAKLNYFMGIFEFAMPWLSRLPAVDNKTKEVFASLDIAGYNYMNGRYEQDLAKYPQRFIIATESSPGSLAGSWPIIAQQPRLLGDFVWAGWDYIGEAGLAAPSYNQWRRLFHPYPALLSGEPIIDITGYRQPQSYHNEIIWGLRASPYLAVQPLCHSTDSQVKSMWRSSDAIRSWTWRGFEGMKATVEVYSYAPLVELRLNDKIVGRSKAGQNNGYKAVFRLPYQGGRLSAINIGTDGERLESDEIATAQHGEQLTLFSDFNGRLTSGCQDVVFITIEVTDGQGIVRPHPDRLVSVLVEGQATLLGLGSAAPFTEDNFTATECHTYYGRAIAAIRSGSDAGSVLVSVRSEGLPDAAYHFEVA